MTALQITSGLSLVGTLRARSKTSNWEGLCKWKKGYDTVVNESEEET